MEHYYEKSYQLIPCRNSNPQSPAGGGGSRDDHSANATGFLIHLRSLTIIHSSVSKTDVT